MTFLSKKTQTALNIPSVTDRQYTELHKLYYNYDQLEDKAVAKWLSNCTIEIRGRQYKSLKEVYHMGKILLQVKEKIGYGFYRDWLEKELIDPGIFGVSTAENYCSVATALETYGYDKLKYFAVSAIYVAGKTKTDVDKEFQQYIFDTVEQKYLETGTQITRAEVLEEKKRFKAIKETNLTEETQEKLLESKVPVEVVNQIKKQPDPDVREEMANKVVGSTCISVEAQTVELKKSFTDIKRVDYDKSASYLVDEGDLAVIQHSLDREGGDVNPTINAFAGKVNVIAVISLPMDLYFINVPTGYVIRNLVFARRPHPRMWNDVSLINQLFAITIMAKEDVPKTAINDLFESFEQALEAIAKIYNVNDKPLYLTRSDANVVGFNSFTDNLISKLNEHTLGKIYVSI